MLDLERSLAACEELNRLIEANDASLDDELLAAQEDFEHEAAMHFEELLRRWKRVRELLAGVDKIDRRIECLSGDYVVRAMSESALAELRELLDLPTGGEA